MAQTQANVQAVFKETYRDYVPKLLESTNVLWAKIKAASDLEKAGPRTLRAPKEMSPGGQFRYAAQDGGDFGRGNAPIYDAMTFTPKLVLEAVEFNQSVRWNTANNKLAVINALADNVASATTEWGVNVDKVIQGNGDGIVATTSTGAGTTSIVLAAPFRGRLLRLNCRYVQMNSAQTIHRGVITLLAYDPVTGTATIDAAPAGATNGDVWVSDGLAVPTPTGINGLQNLCSSATTGTVGGLSRTTYPQLRTANQVASAALTPAILRAAINAPEILRDASVWNDEVFAYGSIAQRQALEEIGLSMALYDKTGGRDGFDPLFAPDKLKINGLRYVGSQNADPTRIDILWPSNFFRAETLPVGLYDVEDDTMFPIYGASGGLAAAEIFYVMGIFDLGIDDPQKHTIISSLSVPSGSLYF